MRVEANNHQSSFWYEHAFGLSEQRVRILNLLKRVGEHEKIERLTLKRQRIW